METPRIRSIVVEGGDASMGPRFCKRGNVLEPNSARQVVMLQWGHAFVSVETAIVAEFGSLENALLQWGHAFVSVETGKGKRASDKAQGASMGPRFCKRGNIYARERTPRRRHRFNGATLL